MTNVSFKSWLTFEANRIGLSVNGVFWRLKRGLYPNIRRIYKNKRVVLVPLPDDLAREIEPPVLHPKAVKCEPAKHLCDCGNVASKKSSAGGFICARCARIEHRLECDYVSRRGGYRSVLAGGLTVHVLHAP